MPIIVTCVFLFGWTSWMSHKVNPDPHFEVSFIFAKWLLLEAVRVGSVVLPLWVAQRSRTTRAR